MSEPVAKINEIFDSIQGEGPFIGYRQLFIRFCGCNLMCNYCDTQFDKGEKYTAAELLDTIKSFDLPSIHSISLTGGEPLLHYEFLKEFLPELKKLKKTVYLETNGTLDTALEQIIEWCDIISMDFKINSTTKIGDLFEKHNRFLEIATASNKDVFAKLVFDENIESFEANECINLAQKYDIELILQPKMSGNNIAISHDKMLEIFNTFTQKHHKTRLIGQVHKFFDIR